jgi:hypothetical protein
MRTLQRIRPRRTPSRSSFLKSIDLTGAMKGANQRTVDTCSNR